jgi:hypothetical protein
MTCRPHNMQGTGETGDRVCVTAVTAAGTAGPSPCTRRGDGRSHSHTWISTLASGTSKATSPTLDRNSVLITFPSRKDLGKRKQYIEA